MRVGVVGAGVMAGVHARAWAAAGATVTGVWSRTPGATAVFGRAHGLTVRPDFETLAAHADLIDVCTPSDTHHGYTLRAAAAGRHVLCEKPMALTLADARAMVDACRAAGVALFVGHAARFYPEYRRAQQVLASGELGPLKVLRLKSVSAAPAKPHDNWYLDPARSGGLLLDLMIHDIDYALWLGGPVRRVSARQVQPTRPEWAGDYALVTLRFASGALAQLEAGWLYPPGRFRSSIDIAGESGLLEYHSDAARPLQTLVRTPPVLAVDEVVVPGAEGADGPFARQCRHVLAVLAGLEAPLLRPEDAVAALEVALAAREAARLAQPVQLQVNA